MTQGELTQYIGRIATFGFKAFADLRFEVRILGAKIAYGQERLLITPTAGSGEQWVNFESVVFSEEAPPAPLENGLRNAG